MMAHQQWTSCCNSSKRNYSQQLPWSKLIAILATTAALSLNETSNMPPSWPTHYHQVASSIKTSITRLRVSQSKCSYRGSSSNPQMTPLNLRFLTWAGLVTCPAWPTHMSSRTWTHSRPSPPTASARATCSHRCRQLRYRDQLKAMAHPLRPLPASPCRGLRIETKTNSSSCSILTNISCPLRTPISSITSTSRVSPSFHPASRCSPSSSRPHSNKLSSRNLLPWAYPSSTHLSAQEKCINNKAQVVHHYGKPIWTVTKFWSPQVLTIKWTSSPLCPSPSRLPPSLWSRLMRNSSSSSWLTLTSPSSSVTRSCSRDNLTTASNSPHLISPTTVQIPSHRGNLLPRPPSVPFHRTPWLHLDLGWKDWVWEAPITWFLNPSPSSHL